MKHEERWQIAVQLVERIAQVYPGQLLLGGVYGSTSRGTDTEWSDLELLIVVEDGCQAQGRHLLLRGTVVGYRVYRRSELEEIVRTPSLKWPFHMGVLSVLKPLYGDPALIKEWLALGQSAPDEKFRAALVEALPDLVYESYGRIMSCRERGNARDITHAAIEVIYEMRQALCLLNRRWVTHDYFEGIRDSFSFPKLPAGYVTLVTALWDVRDIETTVWVATELVNNYSYLLRAEGVVAPMYESIADLPHL